MRKRVARSGVNEFPATSDLVGVVRSVKAVQATSHLSSYAYIRTEPRKHGLQNTRKVKHYPYLQSLQLAINLSIDAAADRHIQAEKLIADAPMAGRKLPKVAA